MLNRQPLYLARLNAWILPSKGQKQPSRTALKKRCSEYMQKIYRRTPMPRVISIKLYSNFMKIAPWHGCSPVNFLHIFRIHFPRNTSAWLLLKGLLSFLTDKSNLLEGLTSVFKLFAEQISLFYIIH